MKITFTKKENEDIAAKINRCLDGPIKLRIQEQIREALEKMSLEILQNISFLVKKIDGESTSTVEFSVEIK